MSRRALTEDHGSNEESKERATLVVQMKRWRDQHMMLVGPIIEQMKEDESFDDEIFPEVYDVEMCTIEEVELPMPSAYPPNVRKHPLFNELVVAESALREAQANVILKHLRTKLTCQSLFKIEMSQHTGQEAKTRDSKILERTNKAIKVLQNEFNAIFNVLCTVDSSLYKGKYELIEDKDIIPFNLYHLKLHESKKRLPWIWRSSLEILHSDKDIKNWNQESK